MVYYDRTSPFTHRAGSVDRMFQRSSRCMDCKLCMRCNRCGSNIIFWCIHADWMYGDYKFYSRRSRPVHSGRKLLPQEPANKKRENSCCCTTLSFINVLPLIGSCVFPRFFVVVGLTASSRVVHSIGPVMTDRLKSKEHIVRNYNVCLLY